MTSEEVGWLLRYPADEFRMSHRTFSRITAAISAGPLPGGGGITYAVLYDANQRQIRLPATLSDRKLILDDTHENKISISLKGSLRVIVDMLD